MVKNFIAIINLCFNNIKRWAVNPRYYVVFAFAFMWINMMISPIRDFSASVGVDVTIWGLPFVFASRYSHMILLLGAVLLFSDVPFMNSSTPYECIRSGKRIWSAAQVTYIVVAAFLYTAFLFIAGIISIVPNISFSGEWGRVYQTLAQTNAGSVYGINFRVPYTMLSQYSAVGANLLSTSIFFAECCLVGNVMFVLSLLISRDVGTCAGLALAFLPCFTSPVLIAGTSVAYYILPTSWANILMLDKNGVTPYPPILYAQTVLLLLNITAAIYIIASAKRRRIEVLMPV